MVYGTLRVNLKGSKVEAEEAKTWLQKFARIFTGEKSLKKQVVTQMQYLENIAKIFEELGWKNVTSVEVNGAVVYEDEAYTEDDLRTAIELAMKQEQKEIYHVQIEFNKIDAEENEDTITVNMYNQGEPDDFPLTVSVDFIGDNAATTMFLNNLIAKINEKFGVESQEVEVDEDDNELEEDAEEEEDTEDELEEKA